jgi:hypothetical protein
MGTNLVRHRRPPRRRLRRLAGLALVAALAAAALPGTASAAGKHTWYVSATATSEPACSVASSVNAFASVAGALACAHNGDVVKVGAGTFAGQFTVPVNVAIEGAGANRTTLVPASSTVPEVTLAPGVSVRIVGLEVNGEGGEGAFRSPGIMMTTGTLLLEKVAVVNTHDDGVEPGSLAPVSVQPTSGTGSVTVLDSTISGNISSGVGGVFVQTPVGSTVQSTATIVNSTIANNVGENYGGGVGALRSPATLRDDTIVGNSGVAGGLNIGEHSTVSVADSIIAGNSGNVPGVDDCKRAAAESTLVDGGHNLIGVAEASYGASCPFVNESNSDIVGTAASPATPMLGALAANGGTTQTMALQPGSPAINAGNPADCEATPVSDLDQRASKRNATTRHTCDIGAYDTGGTGAHVWYVSAKAKAEPACSVASSVNAFVSVAGALACAHNGDVVKVGAGTFAGQFTVPVNVAIEGAGADRTTLVPTANTVPQVTLAPGVSVRIVGLEIDGEGAEARVKGSGIAMTTGSLLLDKVAIVNTYDSGEPGTVAPVSVRPTSGTGSVTVLDSTISGNISTGVGGVLVQTPAGSTAQSSATIVNSTIAQNAGENYAGGVGTLRSLATLRDDTLVGNTGGVGGLSIGEKSTVTVADSIIAGNSGNTPALDDCRREEGTLVDGGHNLIGVAEASYGASCPFVNESNGDIVGTAASPANPMLGALAANGGTTQTMALQPGSPAINAGNPADCEATPVSDLDQRGSKRNATTRHTCDIGAYDTGGA